MKYNVTSIAEYLEAIPKNHREMVVKIISIIETFFPGLKGTMEYNMPTFNPVCAVASQKHHVSVYIHRIELVEKYRNELGNLKVGKSCIRFSKMEQLPEAVLKKIFAEIK